VNRRKTSKWLSPGQVKRLKSAWYHAFKTGRPLNTFVTFRPIDVDALTGPTRC
jgi:hypothetical protein